VDIGSVSAWGVVVSMVSLAGLSALAMVGSVREGEDTAAWIWAVLFVGCSLLAAWLFWRLV
jgi:hypothetical protein